MAATHDAPSWYPFLTTDSPAGLLIRGHVLIYNQLLALVRVSFETMYGRSSLFRLPHPQKRARFGMNDLADFAVAMRLLPPDSIAFFRKLNALRNIVAHSHSQEVASTEARVLLALLPEEMQALAEKRLTDTENVVAVLTVTFVLAYVVIESAIKREWVERERITALLDRVQHITQPLTKEERAKNLQPILEQVTAAIEKLGWPYPDDLVLPTD